MRRRCKHVDVIVGDPAVNDTRSDDFVDGTVDFAGKFGRWIRVTIYWGAPRGFRAGSHVGFMRLSAAESRRIM